MSERIADTLVLILTRGVSLREWERSGLLSREWAMLERLTPHYKRLILVTHGDGTDEALGASLPGGPRIVCNDRGHDPVLYAGDAVKRVSALVREEEGDQASCVIKTNQMDDAGIADALLFDLRASGVQAALIARGGYLRSRFEAKLHGSASREAIDAGRDERRLCAAADLVVGTTGVMIDELAWRCEIASQHTRVIPNYVLTPSSSTKAEERDEKHILCAGRLIARKQFDLIIQGVSALPPSMREGLRLEIVGDGPERRNLAKLADSLGVTLDMPGALPHEQLLQRMSACGVFCQASAFEGHPKTVIEAMATGAPCVVASTPGLGGVIQNGITGLVVPPKPESFTFAISGLLEDPFLRTTLGSAARDTARDRFSIKRIAQLEIQAHRDAVELSERRGDDRARGHEVRWEAPMLLISPEAQAQAWERSLRAFASRLGARPRAQFLAGLDAPLYEMQGLAAVEAEGGLHPKHRLMDYHRFFTERVAPGERVIDLGSGSGALACSLARAGARVVGVDRSDASVNEAESRARELGEHAPSFELGDITEHRAEGTFDTIVLSNVLEHIDRREERLRDWMDWYAPKRVLIRVPAFDREWRVPWKRELGVEWRLDLTHETEYTLDQLERELDGAGLTITDRVIRWGEYWVEARARADELAA
ncbi:MAG: glycosyltransferase [Phycisphaerales bacterium JB059]